MRVMLAGSLNQTVYFQVVEDSAGANPGEPKTGMIFSDFEAGSFVRNGAARVAITMATLASASAAHSDGGLILVDDTNVPGLYRFDIPDTAIATGVDSVVIHLRPKAAQNALAAPLEIELNIETAVWDALRSNHVTDLTFGKSLGALVEAEGVVGASPSPTTNVFDTDITNSNNSFHIGSLAHFIDGSNVGQSRPITALNGTTGLMTVSPGFPVAPGVGDKLAIIPAVPSALIADFVWDEILGGHTTVGSAGEVLGAAPALEISAVPGAKSDLRTMVQLIFQALRNKIITDANTGDTKMHKDDGSVVGTAVVTDAAGVFTREKYI